MANELENTNENQNKENNTADTKELEAKIKQLEAENGKLRQANTAASAEASKYKKEKAEIQEQLNSKLTDDEKAKAEQEAANAAMQKELETLRNERNIAKFTGALVANDIGMDAETAKEVAEALNAGETEKVFEGIRKFIAVHDKSIREDALRNNPTLQGGASTKDITQEQFDSMNLSEMMKFKLEHPEQYAEFMKR